MLGEIQQQRRWMLTTESFPAGFVGRSVLRAGRLKTAFLIKKGLNGGPERLTNHDGFYVLAAADGHPAPHQSNTVGVKCDNMTSRVHPRRPLCSTAASDYPLCEGTPYLIGTGICTPCKPHIVFCVLYLEARLPPI